MNSFNAILQDPTNPFVVWVYVGIYGSVLGYGLYLLWRMSRRKNR